LHPFQGHLLVDVEQGEFVTDTTGAVDTLGGNSVHPVLMSVDMVDGTLVTIQRHGTNYFLCYVEANDSALPFDHFAFVKTTLDAAKQTSSMQFLMEPKDATIILRSACFGDLIGMQRRRDDTMNGFIAAAVDEADDSIALQAVHKDGTLRLIGPRRQHLRLVTITNASGQPYDVLASTSIIPSSHGLFILHHH
jgi:hypothetical protein